MHYLFSVYLTFNLYMFREGLHKCMIHNIDLYTEYHLLLMSSKSARIM